MLTVTRYLEECLLIFLQIFVTSEFFLLKDKFALSKINDNNVKYRHK